MSSTTIRQALKVLSKSGEKVVVEDADEFSFVGTLADVGLNGVEFTSEREKISTNLDFDSVDCVVVRKNRFSIIITSVFLSPIKERGEK